MSPSAARSSCSARARASRTALGFALAFLLMACAGVAAAGAPELPDTVYFKNGDRLIGDVNYLSLGELNLDPPEGDKHNVKWEEVQHLITRKIWNIRTADGHQYRGSFRKSPMSGLLVIQTRYDTLDVKMADVTWFTELKTGWWTRADGSVSFGLSYQNANELAQGTLSSRVQYLVGKERLEFRQYSVRNFQPGVEDVRVDQFNLSWMHDLSGRLAIGPQGGYESNSELNLDERWKGSLMLASRILLKVRMTNIMMAGAQLNAEKSTEGDDRNEAEAFLGNRMQMNFLSHELEMYADTYAYFGLTVKGRTRVTTDITLSVEVVDDWKLGIEFYDQFDTKPPNATESLNDFRVSTTVGWSF